ncbi:hypothetical protein VTN77DRAFT_2648 [Rasamsonia byssochlamydoides]|uniref:uncharacterized protein n=1 Tax=Rasamsonia byssochlamydoides TaxID=89139 RepID=UPI0037423A23
MYLLRPQGENETWGYEPSLPGDPYQGYINSLTGNGILLIRILVKNNTTDVPVVQGLLESSQMTPISRSTGDAKPWPPLTEAVFAGLSNLSLPLQTLELTARLRQANPPFDSSDPAAVEAKLTAAGISNNGTYNQPLGVDLSLANARAQEDIKLYSLVGRQDLNNDWVRYVPQGMYSDNFVARSLLADNGFLDLQPSQALYPFSTAAASMSLDAGDAYLYEFSGKPPTETDGFWSLTMYDAEHFLVPNPFNVYAIGDRSNITYPDGSPVYGPGSDDAENRPFEILIQPADLVPPANWTNK